MKRRRAGLVRALFSTSPLAVPVRGALTGQIVDWPGGPAVRCGA